MLNFKLYHIFNTKENFSVLGLLFDSIPHNTFIHKIKQFLKKFQLALQFIGIEETRNLNM